MYVSQVGDLKGCALNKEERKIKPPFDYEKIYARLIKFSCLFVFFFRVKEWLTHSGYLGKMALTKNCPRILQTGRFRFLTNNFDCTTKE